MKLYIRATIRIVASLQNNITQMNIKVQITLKTKWNKCPTFHPIIHLSHLLNFLMHTFYIIIWFTLFTSRVYFRLDLFYLLLYVLNFVVF